MAFFSNRNSQDSTLTVRVVNIQHPCGFCRSGRICAADPLATGASGKTAFPTPSRFVHDVLIFVKVNHVKASACLEMF